VSDFYCKQVLNGRRAVDVVFEKRRRSGVPPHSPVLQRRPHHVIPKVHVSSLLDPAADPMLPALLAVVRTVAAEVVAGHGAARVLTNLGSYQDSKHLHWHVYAGTDIAQPTERPPGPSSRHIG
jgi:histidine triad (HIT) family protein